MAQKILFYYKIQLTYTNNNHKLAFSEKMSTFVLIKFNPNNNLVWV